MKQLAFLIVSGAPTPKNIAQIFQATIWSNQLISTNFHISILKQ